MFDVLYCQILPRHQVPNFRQYVYPQHFRLPKHCIVLGDSPVSVGPFYHDSIPAPAIRLAAAVPPPSCRFPSPVDLLSHRDRAASWWWSPEHMLRDIFRFPFSGRCLLRAKKNLSERRLEWKSRILHMSLQEFEVSSRRRLCIRRPTRIRSDDRSQLNLGL